MRQQVELEISASQKRAIIEWEIPHLIKFFKARYQLSMVYIVASKLLKKKEFLLDPFNFDGKTYFPLRVGGQFVGVLVCFKNVKQIYIEEINQHIQRYLNRNQPLYPLLIKRTKKEELLKTAHELYLKSSCFAFLNTEDLKWTEGIFQEMKGVFVCVPSFYQLSYLQKKILIHDLTKDQLSCHLVIGVKDQEPLPLEWKSFFHNVI